jgi:hypothetical protein
MRPLSDIESAISQLNRSIKEAVPQVMRVFIEAESPGAHRAQLDQARNRE